MSSTSMSIKFPDKHYVGFQARPSHDEVPLGFMTPDGTDKAAVKRKETVDNWSKSGGYYGRNEAQDTLPAQTYENKPLIGFKLGRNVRHGYGWGQGNVKWRIEDPRGFELEITSPNLAQIMGFCTIQEGEILEECIWARLGAENILVPVNSDVYVNAIKNTERMSKSASLRDLKIGDSVVMHNGDAGIYYGTMFVTRRSSPHYSNGTEIGAKVICGDKKRHVFLMQGADGLASRKFFKAIGSPKLSQVFEGTAMTAYEAELDLAKKVNEEDYSLQESSNDYGSSPIAFTVDKMDSKSFVVERIADTMDRVAQEFDKEETVGHHYYVNKIIDEAVSIFDINGEKISITLRDIYDKRTYLPGGTNYAQVTQRQNYIAQNPNYASHYRNQPELDWVYLNRITSDPATGKILAQVRNNHYGYRNHYDPKDYMPVEDVPNEFTWYRFTATSPAGQVIECAI